jgi:hypothetical protein
MRCEEVTRELSVPTGRLSEPHFAEHLASCSRCAAWAEQCTQFNRLWLATQLPEPVPGEFEFVWSQVCRSVEPQSVPAVVASINQPAQSLRFPRWLRPVSLGLLASAAALFLAWLGLLQAGKNAEPAHPNRGGSLVRVSLPTVEAESGETLFIHISGSDYEAQNVPVSALSDSDTVAAELDVFNHMESLSKMETLSAL